ncbi:interferon-induced protein 44-like [Cheilinus undulatus]|uniref:interferon-induced protein 44-like n=1 Tax=Cheilinus undulatus TaxID=241271 RepID=UPI001BD1C874|nr:interferon-induced protein 44-like [Cheilinus undulatus]
MGGTPSKPEETPFLDRPWREINWRDKAGVLQSVKDYRPNNEGQIIRILLYGPAGAGKTSFINSVQSVLHGRMYAQAMTSHSISGCFTSKYKTYRLQKQDGSFYPFVLNDTMGLSYNGGILENDVKLALKGHVKDGYRFKPETEIAADDPLYNQNPTDNDKVHVLVCVFDPFDISVMPRDTLQMIHNIRVAATELEIPQVVILTKIDDACPEIKKDLKCVYKDKELRRKMEMISAETGIKMNCIFPVKNYSEEIDLNDDADSLILSVLGKLINFGEDCINCKSVHQ